MREMWEYEYEVGGKILYFFEQNGFLCARVNNQETYRRHTDGVWRAETRYRKCMEHAQIEEAWNRHISDHVVDAGPRMYDNWSQQWINQ